MAAEGIWSGLLKWSLAQGDLGSDSYSSTSASDLKPLSDEDRAFLEKVFDTLVVDEVRRIKVITQILRMSEERAAIERMVTESQDFIQALQQVRIAGERARRAEAPSRSSPLPASLDTSTYATQPLALLPPAPTSNSNTSATPASNSSANENADLRNNNTSTSTTTTSTTSNNNTSDTNAAPVDLATVDMRELHRDVLRRKRAALDELDDRVLTIDHAVDFCTVGGFPPLLQTMASRHAALQWRAAHCMATVCQNNPRTQAVAINFRAVPALLATLQASAERARALLADPTASTTTATDDVELEDDEDEDEDDGASRSVETRLALQWKVASKCLYALSAVLRGEDPAALHAFVVEHSGVEVLARLVEHAGTPDNVHTKILPLLALAYASESDARSSLLAATNVWRRAASLIGHDDINVREQAVKFFLTCLRVLDTPPQWQQQLRAVLTSDDVDLQAIVRARTQAVLRLTGDERESCEEELSCCLEVLRALSAGSASVAA